MSLDTTQKQDAAPPNMMASLRSFDVFSSLSEQELSTIVGYFHCRQYVNAQVIIRHKEFGGDVFFLLSGGVRATLYTPSGREITYQDILCGDIFGELSVIDGRPRSTHVIATKDCTVLVMSKESFDRLLQEFPSVASVIMKRMAALIRFLFDQVYEYGALDVNCRVRRELARLADVQGCEEEGEVVIKNMLKHQELANRIATHREAVTRELKQLELSGVIRKSQKDLTILDMGKLQTLDG